MPRRIRHDADATKKTWETISEPNLRKCHAAWAWLQSYYDRPQSNDDVRTLDISSARWSKLVAPCIVIMKDEEKAKQAEARKVAESMVMNLLNKQKGESYLYYEDFLKTEIFE